MLRVINHKKPTEDFITVMIIASLLLSLVASLLEPYSVFAMVLLSVFLVIRVYMVRKRAICLKRQVEVSSSDWQQYWSDRTHVLDRVDLSTILTTDELSNKLSTLIGSLGKLGIEDCEIALITGGVWTNGIATPEELAKIGSRWQGKSFTQSNIESAYELLTEATILLPAQTFPRTDMRVCLISSLERMDEAIKILLKTRHIGNSETHECEELLNSANSLLIDLAINKSEYMLWPFSPDGTVKIVQPKYPDEEIEHLTPETYSEKVMNVVKRADSRLLISLEYGTGITKKPLEEIIEKLEEGIAIEICIAPKPRSKSKFKSQAEIEWEKTNKVLRKLRESGNVTIYEVIEPYHYWHMWLSLEDKRPVEGIGFFRNGCLPFWHETYYAHSKKAPKTLRDLLGYWKEMTENGHWFRKYI